MRLFKLINRSSIIVILLLLLAIIAIGFLMMNFSSLLVFFFALPAFTKNLSVDGGLNRWLAQAIGVGFTVALIVPCWLIIKGRSSLGGKVIRLLLLSCFIIAAYSLAIYGLQQKVIEIKTLKSEGWGKNQLTKLERVKVDQNTALFDPTSGAPRAWYYKHKGGELDIYSGAGKHPQLGEDLKPMDIDTARLVRQYFAANQASRMINPDNFSPINEDKKAETEQPDQKITVDRKSSKISPSGQSPAAVAKESPTQLARKEMMFRLGRFGNYLCQAEPNP